MMKKLCAVLILLMMGGCCMIGCCADETNAQVPALGTARRPIPENDAMAYLKQLGVGWNLGNTFDAIKQGWNANADEMTLETVWCGIETSEAMFKAVRAAGFSTVRIPVSWHDHVDQNGIISQRWLSRVQQVVDWAMEQELYVILNIHHDEDQFLPSDAHFEESAQYVAVIWRQLAESFRDYDDRLIFESMNEPRLIGSNYEWYFDSASAECRMAAECLNRLNQLFVDTVRASGGNNEGRYLMVPGYDASPEGALNDYFLLPADAADNRIIVSVHAYTPYAFALQDGGDTRFNPSGQSQTQEIIGFMNKLYDRYITQGVPVVIGEFGARDKGGNLQDRVNFAAFYTAAASARNMPCLWWDNGAFSGNGEVFGLLDRRNAAFAYPEIVEAIITYGGYDKLPETK